MCEVYFAGVHIWVTFRVLKRLIKVWKTNVESDNRTIRLLTLNYGPGLATGFIFNSSQNLPTFLCVRFHVKES